MDKDFNPMLEQINLKLVPGERNGAKSGLCVGLNIVVFSCKVPITLSVSLYSSTARSDHCQHLALHLQSQQPALTGT